MKPIHSLNIHVNQNHAEQANINTATEKFNKQLNKGIVPKQPRSISLQKPSLKLTTLPTSVLPSQRVFGQISLWFSFFYM